MSAQPSSSVSRPRRKVIRAEAVGSLLRPAAITEALDAIFAGQTCVLRSMVPPEKSAVLRDFTHLVDAAVRRVVKRQIEAGLDVVTDGELRRYSFISSFYDAVEGLTTPAERLIVKDESGKVIYDTYGDPVVVSRIRKTWSPMAEEASFLRGITDFPFKVTLPAPSYFYTPFVELHGSTYDRDREAFIADVIAIEKGLISDAIAAGAGHIQFDFPLYPALVDENYTAQLLTDLGGTADGLLARALKADVAATEGIPEGVTVGLHLCRGNLEGGFWSGSLAPIAERMFAQLPHDRFLFEWEDLTREGDYQPIKYVRKGQTMAMGLVSTKTPALESEDEIIRRLDEAAQYLPTEQLALCTQCGFASICGDHLVQAEEAQWRKLDLIGRVADRVWGNA